MRGRRGGKGGGLFMMLLPVGVPLRRCGGKKASKVEPRKGVSGRIGAAGGDELIERGEEGECRDIRRREEEGGEEVVHDLTPNRGAHPINQGHG